MLWHSSPRDSYCNYEFFRFLYLSVAISDAQGLAVRQSARPSGAEDMKGERDADWMGRMEGRGAILLPSLLIVMQVTAGGVLAEQQKNSALRLLLDNGIITQQEDDQALIRTTYADGANAESHRVPVSFFYRF